MKLAASLRNAFLQVSRSLRMRLYGSRTTADVRQSDEDVTNKDVTRRLNKIYAEEETRLDPVIAELQRRSITKEQW